MSNSKFGFRTRTGTIPALINGLGVYDADAQSFINTAGITDNTQKDAISQLVQDLKSYGIWTKMRALYPFVGGTATSHSYNLKNTAQYQITWFGGVTHNSNGITGNGSNGYGLTGVPANVTPQGSHHLSVYSRSNSSGSATDIAANSTGPTYGSQIILWQLSSTYLNNNGIEVLNPTSDSLGFFLNNRNNITQIVGQKNYTQNTYSATAATWTGSIYHLLRRGDYTSNHYSARNLAFVSIGEGLSNTEALNFYIAIQKFQISLNRFIGGRLVSDSDAQAFVFAAGISDQTQANAIDNLVISLKNAGLWTKMKAIYPFVGGTATTHMYNLKDPRNDNTAFRLSFVGGWTHSTTGALPNGTNAYANTFFSPTAYLTNHNIHLSVYSRTQTIVNNGSELGAQDSAGANYYFLALYYGSISRKVFGAGSYPTDSVAINTANSLGYQIGSRTANNVSKLYFNNSLLGTNTTTYSGNLPANNLYLSGLNVNGSPSDYSTKQVAFATIGDGLSDSEASALYTIVQTYQTALGRQVP